MEQSGLDLTIRASAAADARAIARIHVDAWRSGYRGLLPAELLEQLSIGERERMWRGLLRDEREQHPRRRVDVAIYEGLVAGFVAAGPGQEQDAPSESGEIYAIHVDPAHWSAGVGQALLGSAVAQLAVIGMRDALLWVLQTNARARHFYELAGWTTDGVTKAERLSGLLGFDIEVEQLCYRRPLP